MEGQISNVQPPAAPEGCNLLVIVRKMLSIYIYLLSNRLFVMIDLSHEEAKGSFFLAKTAQTARKDTKKRRAREGREKSTFSGMNLCRSLVSPFFSKLGLECECPRVTRASHERNRRLGRKNENNGTHRTHADIENGRFPAFFEIIEIRVRMRVPTARNDVITLNLTLTLIRR